MARIRNFFVIAAVCVAIGGTGAPAYAADTTPSPPAFEDSIQRIAAAVQHLSGQVEAYTVPADATSEPLARDSYGIVVPRPQVFYPVPMGSISSPFGRRTCAPGDPCSTFHEGDDITPGAGTHIKSIAAGIVRQAGPSGEYGNLVTIDYVIDGRPVTALYAHQEAGSIQVRAGEHVTAGQYIGRVGNTGRSYGAHLHFELHVNGAPVNPLPLMRSLHAAPYPAG